MRAMDGVCRVRDEMGRGDGRKRRECIRHVEDGRHTHVLGLVRRDEARHHLDEGLLDLEMVVLGVAPLRRVSAGLVQLRNCTAR